MAEPISGAFSPKVPMSSGPYMMFSNVGSVTVMFENSSLVSRPINTAILPVVDESGNTEWIKPRSKPKPTGLGSVTYKYSKSVDLVIGSPVYDVVVRYVPSGRPADWPFVRDPIYAV